ncbi:MAG: ABC-type sugar transport system, permease component [Acidimicrobiales bacterium]|nr:ABC-type sugar transport system, permease component [Acidimicrobiales bacterium]
MATDVADVVGADPPAATEGFSAGTTVGRSASRRTAGTIVSYVVLIALAVVVLVPVFYTVLQALSPPFAYINAHHPPHPVAVAWKQRSWWTGGPLSVVGRTVLVALALAWLQLRGGGGSVRTWRLLLVPRRLGAIVVGTLALGIATGPVFTSLAERNGQTTVWVLVAIVAVAATQAAGLWTRGSVAWRIGLLAVLGAVGLVGIAVVAAGADAWTRSWTNAHLGPAMGRSLLMTVLITVCQVVTSVLAAYAFAFLRFPLKRLVFAIVIATLLLPLEVTLAGNVALVRQLNWINSTQALVLPFAATALGTFLILQGFRGIPPEIQDATRLDGYGHVAFLWKFAVPLTRPVVAAFTVIAALGAWNQYLWPRSVIDSDTANTMQIQLRTLAGQDIGNANLTIAGALIAALPVVLLLVAFQKQIIRGLTAGAVK